MSVSGELRRGLSVNPKESACFCPFLSRFASLYASNEDNLIPSKDLYEEYKAKVNAWTTDKNLQKLAARFQAFTSQFKVVAINAGFVYVGGPRRGYRISKVRLGRNLGGEDRDILAEPLGYSLRGYRTRRSVQERERRGVADSPPFVAPVNSEIGKGVFAARNYRAGEDVCEYIGQLIPSGEVEGRLREYDRQNLTYRFIFFAGAHGDEEMVLDGHRNSQGDPIHPDQNLGGTMNHCFKFPNCKIRRDIVGGPRAKDKRVEERRYTFTMCTITDVSAGGELTWNYGDYRRGLEAFMRDKRDS